jgi:crossover junction endodeoxyribonuclease RuvC
MRILGIDPGSRRAGYGLLEVHGSKIKYLASGVLRFDKINKFLDRISPIYHSALKLQQELEFDEIAFESLIYVKSPTSLMKLAQARGAMLAAFADEYHGRIFEYAPNLVKSTVTSDGHARKESVQKGLQMIFGRLEFATDDESDALAIAVTHALHRRTSIRSGHDRTYSG